MVVVSALILTVKVDNPMETMTENLVEWLFMDWDKLYITRKCLCLIGVDVELSKHGIGKFIMNIGEFFLKELC